MSTTERYQELLDDVTQGKLSRRAVLRRGAALGLAAPAIAALLAACGGSSSESTATTAGGGNTGASTTTTTSGGEASPTTASGSSTSTAGGKAGGAGEINLLWWQAPTILNSHLSSGTKDFDASRIALEPLAEFDNDRNLIGVLAADPMPSRDNGMVSQDGLSVTWKLRQGVKWHDGEPFTAKDVEFTFRYLADPKTTATTYGSYINVDKVDVVDDFTIKIHFKEPEPAWYRPFVSSNGYILPQHIMEDFIGEKARNAPFNLKPVGTGAFKIVDFKPGDVGQWERNEDYWDPSKPHFDKVTLKGGGDVTSAARAVLQTGEADWAWNIQVEPNVIKSLESGGKGEVVTTPGAGGTERLEINHSDPNTEMEGQKSYYKNPHPHFKELKVRQALALLLRRDVIAETLYGPGGVATAYTLNNNPDYQPKDVKWEYNPDKAKSLLDEVGAAPGGDGIRVLNGRPLKWLYSTSVNSVRQKTQEIIKDSLKEVGIDVTLKSVDSSVFFSGDAGNPDTLDRFEADLEMFTNGEGVYPNLWYRRYYSADPARDIEQQSNSWSADNFLRYQNPDFNALYDKFKTELDPAKATDMLLQMQTMVLNDVADIGIIARAGVACKANTITGQTDNRWGSSDLWDLNAWDRKKA